MTLSGKTTTDRTSPIEALLRTQPIVAAVVVGLAWLPLTIGLNRLAMALLPTSEHEERLADGIEQTIITVLVLFILLRIGWLRAAWITTRPTLIDGLFGVLSLAVGGAVVVALVGLADVDFGAIKPLAVSLFNFTAIGFAEELWFRGLVFGGLMLAWRGRRHGPLLAAIISSGLFGLIHLDPFLIVFAAMFGLGLAHLVLGTRSIWGAVIVHILFNLLHDLPSATADVTEGWYFQASLLVIPLAALVALANLGRLYAMNRSAIHETPSGTERSAPATLS